MSSFLERLRSRADDRGAMANLRCALVETKKHRAWPILSRLGIDIKDEVKAVIAGLYASHPEETSTGNLGATCKVIEKKKDGGINRTENKLTPTERRFQHLLAAEKGKELYDRVARMVLLAKSQGVPVNYEQLEKDMRWWTDRTKTEWAAAFWASNAPALVDEEGQ